MRYESTGYDDSSKPVGTLNEQDRLQRFKDWLKLSQEADARQRIRESEDLAFQRAENQWPEAARRERGDRPMLSISLLAQPTQLVKNQAANARLGVTLSAVNEGADDEIAEIKQGLYQRIQRDGMASQARLWALDRAILAGRGWYRIGTQYDEDSDNPSDQEIVFERILYQEMVFPDPAAQKPDFSDGRFLFYAAYMPCDVFRQLYPEAKTYTTEGFAEIQPEAPGWVRVRGERVEPLVAECFYKEITFEDIEIPTDSGEPFRRKREVCTVHRAVMTGCEILEDQVWPGKYIPFVPTIGQELQPIEGERCWEGMVRGARDGQMVYNYAISSMVEDVSRLGKAPYVGVEGQFEGWEQDWEQVNRKNFPFIQYKNVTLGDKPAPPPQPMQIDGTKMGISASLAEQAKGFVQVSTAVYEPSLGNNTQGEKQSGRAIQALQQQADAGTGNYLGNLGAISIPYEARIILDLIPKIYDRPGRITQILGGEDEPQTVMLNQPFVTDPATQKPRAYVPPPGTPPNAPLPQGVKHYDLSKGRYAIAVNVGKSYQTRLEQGANEIGDILSSAPDLMAVIGDIYFKFRDFPGAKEISERLAKLREKTNPGLGSDKNGQPPPEEMAARAQALEQQVQQLTAQLQQATQIIETEQAKQQATIQKAQLDAQAGAQKSQLDAQTKVMLEEMRLQNEERDRALQLEIQQMKQAFEMRLAEFEAAHDVAMAAAGANSTKITRENGQDSQREDSRERLDGQSRAPQPKES